MGGVGAEEAKEEVEEEAQAVAAAGDSRLHPLAIHPDSDR